MLEFAKFIYTDVLRSISKKCFLVLAMTGEKLIEDARGEKHQREVGLLYK